MSELEEEEKAGGVKEQPETQEGKSAEREREIERKEQKNRQKEGWIFVGEDVFGVLCWQMEPNSTDSAGEVYVLVAPKEKVTEL